MYSGNMRTITTSGVTTLKADAERVGFRVDMISDGTVEFGDGGGKVPVKAGSFYEPLVCPIGNITIESAGGYVITFREGADVSDVNSGSEPVRVLLEKQLIKLVAFGDSFTDNGDSTRQANGSYSISTAGYWGWLWGMSSQEFEMLDGLGVTGNQTRDILARVPSVLATDADVVVLMGGTNDLNAGETPEFARDGMRQVLDALIAGGKYVLLVPVAHRRMTDGLNTKIDTLNELYAELVAERSDRVVMAKSSEAFNALSAANSREATTDGLHPTGYGASLIASEAVKTLDAHFKSLPLVRTNYAPNPDLAGVSGVLYSGATGQVPDDWRLYFADPTNDGSSLGVGGVVGGDGTVTLRSGNSTTVANAAKAFFRTGDVIVPQGGEWSFELEVTCAYTGNAVQHKVYMSCSDPARGIVEFQGSRFSELMNFNKFRMRTPYQDIGTATKVQLYYLVETDGTGVIESVVAKPRLVKKP
ncbi:GDSL-like Lipase / SGNH-Hydrolase [Vibrio phage JSF7]|uniref:GDSL-like Lipase / SGNH-Hydrolase n=1 Tax=Vibrio phage JSF7 TaxID=1292086 RepID=A0A240EWW1_9CAUD|nr:lipase [Vibrio phage JSF7]APD18153.1 GDSL-like Lipase / SGNH-Hydrolase [Vibrio phage JSF7]